MKSGSAHPVSRHTNGIVVACFAAIICAYALCRVGAATSLGTSGPVALQLRLDPNTASWQDLAALPELGESAAKRIVAYREQQRAGGKPVPFQKPEDLDAVRGIGPRTIENLRPYLRCPASQP
jgi:hypothetical protein